MQDNFLFLLFSLFHVVSSATSLLFFQPSSFLFISCLSAHLVIWIQVKSGMNWTFIQRQKYVLVRNLLNALKIIVIWASFIYKIAKELQDFIGSMQV